MSRYRSRTGGLTYADLGLASLSALGLAEGDAEPVLSRNVAVLHDALNRNSAVYIPSGMLVCGINDEIEIGGAAGVAASDTKNDRVIFGAGRLSSIQQFTYGLCTFRFYGSGLRVENLYFKNPLGRQRTGYAAGFADDAPFSRPAGICVMGDNYVVDGCIFDDMVVGVRPRALNRKAGLIRNGVIRATFERYLFAVLATNQYQPNFDLYGKAPDVMAAAQPPHLLYLTGAAYLEGMSGGDPDLPDGVIPAPPYDTRNVGGFFFLREEDNQYASTGKFRSCDGGVIWLDGQRVQRGLDVGYCQGVQVNAPTGLLVRGKSYEANPADQQPASDTSASLVNFAQSRDCKVIGGVARNEEGNDFAIAVKVRDGCDRITVEGTESQINYSASASSPAPFQVTRANATFKNIRGRDGGTGSVNPLVSIFGGRQVKVLRPEWSRANTNDIPVVIDDADSVGTYVEIGPESRPLATTGPFVSGGIGSRLEYVSGGIPRVGVEDLWDPTDRTTSQRKIFTDGAAVTHDIYSDGAAWKYEADDTDVQVLAFALQPLDTLTDAIVYASVAVENITAVQFQLYNASNVPLGESMAARVVTSDGYLTGFAYCNFVAPATGTGYYLKASVYPGTALVVSSDPFDTSTDSADVWVPNALGAAKIFAGDSNVTTSAYVVSNRVTEFRDIDNPANKLVMKGTLQPLLLNEGRDGTRKAIACNAGSYMAADGGNAALLAAFDTANIQTGKYVVIIGFRVSSGTRRLLGAWKLGTNPGQRFAMRQVGDNGRDVQFKGDSGSLQSIAPSPPIPDDPLYHVLTTRKVDAAVTGFIDALDVGAPYFSGTITATGALNPDEFLVGAHAETGAITTGAVNGVCALLVIAGDVSDADLSLAARWVARKTGMVIPPP